MWREVLSAYIQDVQQRQRIALALGVHPLTLVRWANHSSTPRSQYLRELPNFLPEQRELVWNAIQEEFPALRELNYKDTTDKAATPVDFSRRIVRLLAVTSPAMRFEVLCDAILGEAVNVLDPHNHGVAVLVARCMPPVSGEKVRSLLVVKARGTTPWEQLVEQPEVFLGIESLAGRAVSTLGPVMGAHLFDDPAHAGYHSYFGDQIQSAIAAPILHLGMVGGCVVALSSQPYSFSFLTQRDFKDIATLLALSFEPESFYAPEHIGLASLPSYTMQRGRLVSYNQRLSHLLTNRHEHLPGYTRAAQSIWSEIEQEVLQLSPSFSNEKKQTVIDKSSRYQDAPVV